MQNFPTVSVEIEEAPMGLVPPFTVPNLPKVKIVGDEQSGGNFTLVDYNTETKQLTIQEGLLDQEAIQTLAHHFDQAEFWQMKEMDRGETKDAGYKSITIARGTQTKTVVITGYPENSQPEHFRNLYTFILNLVSPHVESSKTFQLVRE